MSLFRFRKLSVKQIVLFLFAVIFAAMIISCKKKNADNQTGAETENTEDKKSKNKEYDFYSPEEDDASWVDSLLVRIEEERIAEELAQMEASRSEYLLDDEDADWSDEYENSEAENEDGLEGEAREEQAEEEELSEIEKFFEEAGEGRVLSGKNNELRFYEFQNEILSPQPSKDGFIIVHSTDGNVIRNFYNEQYQLVKKEEWFIRNVADAKKVSTENYIYSEESGKVIKKEITKIDSYELVSYNEAASPLTSKKYAVKDGKQYISMERSWNYDDQNRVIKDEKKEYTYKKSDYKTKPEVFIRRYEYKYNDAENKNDEAENKSDEKNEIPPDFKYFENNVLKMQNKYSSEKGNYVSWVYFDDAFSVKAYYEDEVRVRDEYYNNGKLFRSKTYEKAGDAENAENSENTEKVIHQGAE